MNLQRRLSFHEIGQNENVKDLTSDLLSLKFETALSSEELKYALLRSRHHCFTVTSCAYAVYLVSTFNEMRQVLSEMRNPINKKTIKFLHQSVPRDATKLGIIGCGRLGKQILSCLLTFCDIKTDEIIISTRRPNLLNTYEKSGIKCVYDNQQVVSECHIVFLCCLPSQINEVAESVVGHISKDCMICSFVTGVTLPRLKQLFCHNSITKMEYTWSSKNSRNRWCLGEDMVSALKKEWVAKAVYPLSDTHKENSIVWCNPKAIETAIYGCLNMCPSLGVSTEEAIYLMNMVFLGIAEPERGFQWKDILDEESLSFVNSGNLPVFDLFHIGTQNTPLTHLLQSGEQRSLMVKKYMTIFNQFKNP